MERKRNPELDRFTALFDDCVKTRPSRAHFRTYLAGQLSDLPRKSAKAIADWAGTPPRSLQGFLSVHRWDDRAVRDRVRALVDAGHADPDAIALIGETSSPKKGAKTPGVQRQHHGASATRNCVITCHLGYAAGPFHTLLDADVYLPATNWRANRERCREAGIPDAVEYRQRWRIALDLLRDAVDGGLSMRWVHADEAYGGAPEFRRGVAGLGLLYVVEIPPDARGQLALRGEDQSARRVDGLWKRGGPPWERWRVDDPDEGPAEWDVRAVRFRPIEEDGVGEEQRLLIIRDGVRDKTRYFLSNAPLDAPIGALLRVAFAGRRMEELIGVAKREAGLDHFEGRRYLGLRRHLVLSSVTLLFLAKQRARRRQLEVSPAQDK